MSGATLHILPRAADNGAWRDCLALLQADDSVLLIEDGVLLAVGASAPLTAAGATLRALEADVAARGLGGKLPAGVELIDDAGFVALVVDHARSITWT